jgi:cytochrome c553
MPKHIIRLLILMVAFAGVAIFAKSFFTVDSFYRYGHYRADSVPEIAAQETGFQTSRACVACHPLRHAEWSANVHKAVICEVCHGAAQGHPQKAHLTVPSETVRLCTQCHEAMPGRPLTSIRQIVVGKHPPGPDCIACHNPHAPKIGATVEAAADGHAGQAGAGNCAACHGPNGLSPNPDWPNLAGQSRAYLTRALANFREGVRKNDMMGPMAQPLQDGEVRNLAAYFSGLSCKAPAGKTSTAAAPAVRELAAGCASCHGDGGRGGSNDALPRLAAQNAGYLSATLTAFKAGQRGSPIMTQVAQKLADTEIAPLAAYFAAQGCTSHSQNEPKP